MLRSLRGDGPGGGGVGFFGPEISGDVLNSCEGHFIYCFEMCIFCIHFLC